jgi:hypothetical protein
VYVHSSILREDILIETGTISAVYPPTPVTMYRSEYGQNKQRKEDWERVTWNVDAQPAGSMVDKATGLEVSYLFWEGKFSSLFMLLNPADYQPST